MEKFVGEIILVAFNFAPVGFLPCDGRLLQISQYSALFSLLGTTYGGDGIHTFAIPHLPHTPSTQPSGLECICVNGLFPSRG